MKQQGKHIRYLKYVLDVLLSNVYLIITFCAVWIILLHSKEINYILNSIYNIFNMDTCNNGDQQNLNLLHKIWILISRTIITTSVTILLNTFILKNFSDIKKKRSRRRGKVYRSLNKLYNKPDKRWAHVVVPACINVFFHGKPLGYSSQLDYVHDVIKYLDNSNKHIIWIKGEAYSGKTTIIFRFLEELSAKTYTRLFEEYEQKIYYYDLSFSSLDITSLFLKMEDRTYEDSLLILDNIHKLDSNELKNLTCALENFHARVKFIICLSRKYEEFCFSPEISERLHNFEEQYAVPVIINSDSKKDKNILEEIFFSTENFRGTYDEFCNKIIFEKEQLSNPVLAVQYYNLYLSTYNQINPKFILTVFNTINHNTYEPSLAYVLSFIIHASLFSGSFDYKWFHAFLKANKNKCRRHKVKKYLSKLLKSGFVSVVEYSDTDGIAFHEKLAQYYFEIISRNPDFLDINNRVIDFLAQKNIMCNSFPIAWRYKILIDPTSREVNELFNKSLFSANFKVLLNDLLYIIKEKNYPEKMFYRELGILYDRIGSLDLAKEYFEKSIKSSFDPVIYINLVQVDHGKFKLKTLKPYINGETGDAYMKIAAKYWKSHIDMHDGRFVFRDFIDLLPEWEKHGTEILANYSYDGLHLMRRWYFDCFRVYYLSGASDPDLIKDIIDSNLFSAIYELPEFGAYQNKFQYAFYLHYDLLFQRGIFGTIRNIDLEKWDSIMMGKNGIYQKLKQAYQLGESQINIIIDEAEKHYQASCYGLQRVMDKTYRYAEMRIRELILARDNVSFEDIRNNKIYFEEYIQHSKDINIDEYVAYGYTYLLKNYLVGQFSICSEYDDNPGLHNELENLYINDNIICECIQNIEASSVCVRNI